MLDGRIHMRQGQRHMLEGQLHKLPRTAPQDTNTIWHVKGTALKAIWIMPHATRTVPQATGTHLQVTGRASQH